MTERDGKVELPYKFTGKELDKETGFTYFGARYYDGKLSKWISSDPPLNTGEYLPTGNKNKDNNLPGMGGIFNSINLNAYQYAGNNPIMYTDPNGNDIITEWALFRNGLPKPTYYILQC